MPSSPDAPTVDLCSCEAFEVWYVEKRWRDEGGIVVCRCGHPYAEHVGGTCVGTVVIR